jgi:hypothetical protein
MGTADGVRPWQIAVALSNKSKPVTAILHVARDWLEAGTPDRFALMCMRLFHNLCLHPTTGSE